MSLERFHQAQSGPSGYSTALLETRSGRKQSHWIWYVFPQLATLGRSPTAQFYGIRDLDEACDYLRDPILGARYAEISASVDGHLATGLSVEYLMGGKTDALKLVSSITLFHAATRRLGSEFRHLEHLCDTILQKVSAQGFPPCAFTRQHTGESCANEKLPPPSFTNET